MTTAKLAQKELTYIRILLGKDGPLGPLVLDIAQFIARFRPRLKPMEMFPSIGSILLYDNGEGWTNMSLYVGGNQILCLGDSQLPELHDISFWREHCVGHMFWPDDFEEEELW